LKSVTTGDVAAAILDVKPHSLTHFTAVLLRFHTG